MSSSLRSVVPSSAAANVTAGAVKKAGPACKACCAPLCEAFCKVMPKGYGCVVATGIASIGVNMWLQGQVMKGRKEFKVEYPLLYSPENNFDNKFNCIQRGHQNFIESYPQFLFLLFTGGLACPDIASIAGSVYLAGRILYMKGYATGKPENRRRGGYLAHLGELVLLLLTAKLAYNLFKINGCGCCEYICNTFGLCKK